MQLMGSVGVKVRETGPRPWRDDSDLSGPRHAIHRPQAPVPTHWLHATTAMRCNGHTTGIRSISLIATTNTSTS